MATVLVVDDEKEIRELLTFILEKDGHRVVAAVNGQACLDHVKMEKPDLIVLDVMMPDMDGYTVFTRLSENDETRSIPVIILTAKGQMRDVFEMSSSVAGYIHKPFDPQNFRERVAKILQSRSR